MAFESERLERIRFNGSSDEQDEVFCARIIKFLNHPHIDKYCMVDAHYYDFSVIPDEIRSKYDFCRDVYCIYGITHKGEIVSKWIDRWDLDSDKEIINGKIKER